MMQTLMTMDGGRIQVTRLLVGLDMNVINADGETIATVALNDPEAWTLFRALGEELNA
ncbi:hypothetical protein [Streptomyces katsurahamanus]|uniref:hypothetical protein n=1 Tax=Streptomyces katsurahamanus TaxID=2577098 RepID=UPI001297A136|nr:hypothetical protein [Streptomyces katsurahamanus]